MNVVRSLAFIPLFTAALLLQTFAQESSLPEYGHISDLVSLHKVYLAADSTDGRKLILKELKKYPDLTV
ncbi:MAG: hypothetical protein ACRD6N_19945, partial [Pyrinomonadaceae bacterium]